jgi:integrase
MSTNMTSAAPTRSKIVTMKARPLKSGLFSYSVYIRHPSGEEELIPLPALSRAEDRPAALAKRDEVRAALRTTKVLTCDQWFAKYHAYALTLGQTDVETKRTRWNKWISPRIGTKAVTSLSRADIEDIRDALDAAIAKWAPGKANKMGTCISGKTAMNVWTALTSSCKAATSSKCRDLRVLSINPCVGVEPPGTKDTRRARRKTFLYPREAHTLLAFEDVPIEWRQIYAIALYTYLRPGELRVLTWGDVTDATIRVTKSWDYAEGKIKTPKTQNGVREIPIEAALLPLLANMRDGQSASSLVVPTLGTFGEDHLAEQFREHLNAANVKRTELHTSTATHVQANFRTCRDSGITWLALAGVDTKKIVRRAGHDDPKTTMGYVKLAEDIAGDLGVPFGLLPASIAAREPDGNREPSCLASSENPIAFQDPIEREKGFEPSTSTLAIPSHVLRARDISHGSTSGPPFIPPVRSG